MAGCTGDDGDAIDNDEAQMAASVVIQSLRAEVETLKDQLSVKIEKNNVISSTPAEKEEEAINMKEVKEVSAKYE